MPDPLGSPDAILRASELDTKALCSYCGALVARGDVCPVCGAASQPAEQSLDSLSLSALVTKVNELPDANGAFSRPSADGIGSQSAETSQRLRVGLDGANNQRPSEVSCFGPGALIAGRYRIIELLGRGGMGEVYRATDLALAQTVALKFLPRDTSTNKGLLELFHNEARVARQVTHPNVCRVYDIGEAEGMPFISMEYVDGEDLAALLFRIGSLAANKASEITRELFLGLAAAHAQGIIHRDLKPHNVMLNKQGHVVIMDFGLASVTDRIEGNDARSGSPAYMAPEQLRGASVSAKSDLYSAGLIAYQVFTGKHPFEGSSIPELLRAQEADHPEPVSRIVSNIDPTTERAIMLCIRYDPALRPVSARAVAGALPGSDPLSAALAAGETPSPELVAASGNAEGIRLSVATICLSVVIVAMTLIPIIGKPTSILAMAPLDYSPPVLEQKARDFAGLFGYDSKPTDSDSWLQYNQPLINFLRQHKGTVSWSREFQAASPIDFYYRQSDRYMAALPDGVISTSEPPMARAGDIILLLDSKGYLRRFLAYPDVYKSNRQNATLDLPAIFEEIGLDYSQFVEARPSFVPAVPFDERRAFLGPYKGLPNVQASVEVAEWHGALTSIWVEPPWISKPTDDLHGTSTELILTSVYALLRTIGLILAVIFARRNLRLGRIDRRGAFRVACAACALELGSSVFAVHLSPSAQMSRVAFGCISGSLFWGMLIWLLYLATEPTVRARWPHSLVTWNRLLAGRIADKRVGSDLLIGATTGVIGAYLFLFRLQWLTSAGGPPDGPSANILSGLGPLLSKLLGRGTGALLWAFTIFLLVCGARALLRRDWVAALLAGAAMTFLEGNVRHSTTIGLDAPIYFVFYVGLTLSLVRFGLLPAVISLFVINVAGDVPISGTFSAWYNWEAFVYISVIILVTIYGFAQSQKAITAIDPFYS